MKFKTSLILSLALCFLCLHANSQTKGLGSWNVLSLKYKFNPKVSFFSEAQLRSLKFYDHFHYYEYKGGIHYHAYPNAQFSLGAGSYQTYAEGGTFETPKNNDEFRIWPQIILTQTIDKIKVEQRYRAEMRFTSSGYRNRFRYRLEVSKEFGVSNNGLKPLKILANNELFFTNNEPYFERNRSQVALAYKLNKTSAIQLGYLHQFDYKINDEIGRDFLHVAYQIDF